MKKVIFKIDELESFRREWNRNNTVPEEEIENILNGLNPFVLTYILSRDDKGLERYEIIDPNGNNHSCNEYNPHERTIFGECYTYFSKWLHDGKKPKKLPHGVIEAEYVKE